MKSERFDMIVIGGGIVGLAAALKLKEARPGLSVAVVEKEERIACHQTGHNSGVIHAGVYYRPGSRKARSCLRGRRMLIDFCEREQVPYERCGKLIVATRKSELPALERLYHRAMENGLTRVRKLRGGDIRDYEPHGTGLAGLHVPDTGIVDYGAVAAKYADIFENRFGGCLILGAGVHNLIEDDRGVVVETGRGDLSAGLVVNTAGLYCDRVARHVIGRLGIRIIPFRGEYCTLREDRRHLVNHLIYPVPDPNFPFLGVHFTRRIDGGVEAGPNAVWAFRREGYRRSDFQFDEFCDALLWPGFQRVVRQYWRKGLGEYYRSFCKNALAASLQRLVPDLRAADLVPGGAGVRAQACDRHGRLLDDFLITQTRKTIHVLNAPSPAATASLAIGEGVARRALLAGG